MDKSVTFQQVEDHPSQPRRWLALGAILTGAFLTNLDTFILNVAFVSIQRELGISYATMEMIIVGYTLAFGTLLITAGRLGDRFGRKLIFIVGLGSFTLTSILCGIAPTGELLVAARVAQGISAAMLLPQVFSLIRVGFPEPRDRAKAFALLGGAFGLSSIAGQVVGGVLVSSNLLGLGWRTVFLINLPFGILAIAAAAFWVEKSSTRTAETFDFAGVILSALGLFLFLFPLIHSTDRGWPLSSLVMLSIAIPLLFSFVFHQNKLKRRHLSPLLDMSLFKVRAFRAGLTIGFVLYTSLVPFNLFLAVVLQKGIGLSPYEAGLTFTWAAGPFMVASLLTARVATPWGRTMMTLGAILVLLASLFLLFTLREASELGASQLFIPLALMGTGYGFLETPVLNVTLSKIEVAAAGMASGAITTMRQIGGAVGIAVVGLFFKAILDQGYTSAFQYVVTYQVAAMALIIMMVPMLSGQTELKNTVA